MITMETVAKMAGFHMKDFGYLNGYEEIPEEVANCEHEKQGREIGNCAWEYYCPICKIMYSIDSSG